MPLALVLALGVYYETHERWWNAGLWWDVAWIACVLMPAVFALVLLGLPLREWRPLQRFYGHTFGGVQVRARGIFVVGAAFVALAVVLEVAGAGLAANFARLGATAFLGWWFLSFFETVSWVLLVALIIPWVDAYSVWRGPTKQIVTHHEHVFSVLSFAFPVPGERAAANLGVPDLLFFALFLGAASRFGLRVLPTWIGLVASLGITIALTVYFDLSGLPALPGIALGFLVPNADLLWRTVRTGPVQGQSLDVP
jgi:hypothetical protein